jgi:hypothetical protein
MNQGHLVLFAIPVICIIVIAFTQFRDEMFKKRFILERRTKAGKSHDPNHTRRYNDSKMPGAQSETAAEPSAATGTSTFETSGASQ